MPEGSFAIANTANGPGKAIDSAYAQVTQAARIANIRLAGYVDVAFGDRLVQARHDAQAWRTLYDLDAIMFDRVPSDVHHYAAINSMILPLRRSGLQVIANFGHPYLDPCWRATADILGVFEGHYDSYRSIQIPAWMHALSPTRLWHLVYGVTAIDLDHVVDLASESNAGILYATSGDLPNPWASLPHYWPHLIQHCNDQSQGLPAAIAG